MDFKGDVRFLLLLGAGVVAAAWAFTYAGSVQQLVSTGTNGYITMVQGLEPAAARGGVMGGGGTIPQSVTTSQLSGGSPYAGVGWG